MSLLYRLKSHIPAKWLLPYHYALARFAAFFYGHPARKLVVIGVTGTNGKTTTSYLIAKALEASGHQTACTTTAIMKVGEKEWINRTKMTMPGRFFVQRMLRDMVNAGCKYAVIETSSQGLVQYRHLGVEYDIAVFTNLTPEHLESHGGFEAYKQAKAVLFKAVAEAPSKTIEGKPVSKAFVLNRASDHADFYASQGPEVRNLRYGLQEQEGDLVATNIVYQAKSTTCRVDGAPLSLSLPGKHNLENALAALGVCRVLGVDLRGAAKKLSEVPGVPGRLERVEAGQPWTVIIDYAYEPEALQKCLDALKVVPHKRLIHVLGSCGGGRDVSRRPLLGAFAAKHADIAIVTNEDPYDEHPQGIIDQIIAGAVAEGRVLNEGIYSILDRQAAINKAMEFAQPGDLVLLTGKGCEPWICVADGKKLPWDERTAAEQAIKTALARKGV
ncbi:UDP-N-acetylmuramoyl-L-alanyl-D-glutamate--2,6-diaminopimelate ligase [Patescibacteria group bacterium]|nr:UDP-N-acetylmuramoyl-L-alanyl-D-glutamate--2,6-diaminopimelate ligase [Patescibacteria group bacterium]MBP9710533.1 UDP-N-acetylmuramoyl-L-alanyl-D-glutamate--2,6-diaminopimelate ligase [Patescibacteria group bacterium]